MDIVSSLRQQDKASNTRGQKPKIQLKNSKERHSRLAIPSLASMFS